MRCLAIAIVYLAGGLAVTTAQQPSPEVFEKTVKPFLTRNCFGCHNAAMKAGQLDMTPVRDPETALMERDIWEKAAVRIKTGQMPPPPIPKPDPKRVAAVLDWMDKRVDHADRTRKPDPGRVTARRLNRAEYNNTIRDLLGVSFRPADDFPVDDSGYGFDNIGDVLSLSPSLMEKYLNAADEITRLAIVTAPPPKPMFDRYDLDKVGQAQRLPADPEGERLSRRGAVMARHMFPREAEYEFKLTVRGRGVPEAPNEKLVFLLGGRQLQVLDVEHGQNKKRTWEFRLPVKAGELELGAAFVAPGPKQGDPTDPAQTLLADSIEVRGPYLPDSAPLPETHRRIFICSPEGDTGDCARRILDNFTRRAWRRPVKPAEMDKLLGLVKLAAAQGDTFEKGIQLAVKAALSSPNFLFRLEQDPDPNDPARPHRINDYELASRLSYFLWSSMPDDELFTLAGRNSLHEPAVLDSQVRRMIADPKSQALAENFAGQWLELRNLNSVFPDQRKFPAFDSDLREAMRRETILFFNSILKEDRSILDFIDARYTFLNERLAAHYGIQGVEGRQFRRVQLDGEQRGGVLTHASVLTVTSYPTRTSPVLRGLWVLENFLGTPPPAPPANVPQLKEEEIGKTMSLRRQLEKHRADPGCAVCHDKMDALGFGLENYDAVGAWRNQDGNFPVDVAGVLPGGKQFTTPAQMKSILRQDQELFTHMLVEKMLTYALGRGLESYDKPVVRSVARDVAASDHRFVSMILRIVNSLPFQMRRGDPAGKR
jgi:hypothetical protein